MECCQSNQRESRHRRRHHRHYCRSVPKNGPEMKVHCLVLEQSEREHQGPEKLSRRIPFGSDCDSPAYFFSRAKNLSLLLMLSPSSIFLVRTRTFGVTWERGTIGRSLERPKGACHTASTGAAMCRSCIPVNRNRRDGAEGV